MFKNSVAELTTNSKSFQVNHKICLENMIEIKYIDIKSVV